MKAKYFTIVSCSFIASLLISNIAAQKLTILWGFIFTGGIYLFPFTYILNDVITEVYGYHKAKIVIWTAFGLCAFMSIFLQLIVWLPPAPGWENQEAFSTILKQVPRIFMSSLIGFWIGSFLNAFIMAKMKVITKGKYLWMRTIGSTVIGELGDTAVFVILAFYGIIPNNILIVTMLSGFIFKVAYEGIATPLTYVIIKWFKKNENMDVYDYKDQTKFNPFKLSK